MTLKDLVTTERRRWIDVSRELTEVLAGHGAPPMYDNRLNRLRAGKKATEAELRALDEWSCGAVDSYRDEV